MIQLMAIYMQQVPVPAVPEYLHFSASLKDILYVYLSAAKLKRRLEILVVDSCAVVIYLLSTFVQSTQNRQRWLLPMGLFFPL